MAEGFIVSYDYQPVPFILSNPAPYIYHKHLQTKVKPISQNLLAEHKYTADFRIDWAEKARGLFFNGFKDFVNLKKIPFIAAQRNISYIEIKPGTKGKASKRAFDPHSTLREFAINQKWVWQNYGIYVQKIIISNKKQGIFAKTFTPVKYLKTPTNRNKKLHYAPIPLVLFVHESSK